MNVREFFRVTRTQSLVFMLLTACANGKHGLDVPPDYDHLIGKQFSVSVYMGRKVYKNVRDVGPIEELENRRSDGCILVFGVRKANDIIEYWRVDSGPGTCFTTRNPTSV